MVWSQITSACLHHSGTQSGQGAAMRFPAPGFNLEVKEQTQVIEGEDEEEAGNKTRRVLE